MLCDDVSGRRVVELVDELECSVRGIRLANIECLSWHVYRGIPGQLLFQRYYSELHPTAFIVIIILCVRLLQYS